MKYVHMFQWNIPVDNHFTGATDGYINIIAEWNGTSFYCKDKPMIHVSPVNLSFHECIIVKDWALAHRQIEKLAENHFAEIAKAERLAQARAELIAAGEPTGIPTLDLYSEAEKDLIVQEHLS